MRQLLILTCLLTITTAAAADPDTPQPAEPPEVTADPKIAARLKALLPPPLKGWTAGPVQCEVCKPSSASSKPDPKQVFLSRSYTRARDDATVLVQFSTKASVGRGLAMMAELSQPEDPLFGNPMDDQNQRSSVQKGKDWIVHTSEVKKAYDVSNARMGKGASLMAVYREKLTVTLSSSTPELRPLNRLFLRVKMQDKRLRGVLRLLK